MKPCIKKILVAVSAVSLFTGISPMARSAWSATAPYVSVLPSIFEGISLPVRIAPDIDSLGNQTGNYYVSDPRGGGILKYNNAGKLQSVFKTVTNGHGMAVTRSGKLLVAQDTTVAILDKSTGALSGTFGNFTEAHGVAIDASDNIFVTDSIDNVVKVFDSSFGLLRVFGSFGNSANQFIRPTCITYEKSTGYMAVCDTLNGRIHFVNATGLTQFTIPADNPLTGVAYGVGESGQNRFTSLKGVSFQYAANGSLSRIYAADTFQSNIQVFDGVAPYNPLNAIGVGVNDAASHPKNDPYIGSYGFLKGNLVTPFDILFDATNSTTPRLITANGSGSLVIYGIDSLQPSNVRINHPTLFNQLTLAWTNPPASAGFKNITIYRSTSAGQLGTAVASGLTGTTFTDSGLTDNTTYFYTVRALNTALAESNNTDQVSETTMGTYTLTANLSFLSTAIGTGSGTVTAKNNSDNSQVLSCITATCSAPVHSGDVITLSYTPGQNSIFSGWSGTACQTQSGDCVVTIDQAKTVNAVFSYQHLFKVEGGAYRDNLQSAYDIAPNGVKVMAMSGTVPATALALSAEQAKVVTLIGGYDAGYTASSTNTVVQGKVSIVAGKVVMKNIKIK